MTEKNKVDVKENAPLVSIIVPVYNVEQYLDHCVQTIVSQTYDNLEIILIDDGSTDSSGTLCDKWKAKDSRIRVIHQANGGQSNARNTGLNIAQGDYVSFVDSDDYVDPRLIETLLNNLLANNAQLSIVGAERVYSRTANIRKQAPHTFVMNAEEAFQYINLPKYFSVAVWGKLVHINLFENLFFPENTTSEDFPVTYELINRSSRIVYEDQPLYMYYQRSGSLSSTVTTAPYNFTKDMVNLVRSKYPKSINFALYRHIAIGLGVYDTILINGQRSKWLAFEQDLTKTVRDNYRAVVHSVPLTTARRMQLFAFRHFPTLYRIAFPLYKKIHPKLVS